MSDRDCLCIHTEDAGYNEFAEPDDIAAVQSGLRSLAAKTCHPLVRACLEQAHDDIAHLTSCEDQSQADYGDIAAA